MGTKTVHRSEKVSKQVEKKPRASSQLSDGAKALLAERRHVVNQWRGRRISPELAVARLSDLAHIDDDGTAWRLLPRPDGVALVKTGVDGEAVVIDPPAKYP